MIDYMGHPAPGVNLSNDNDPEHRAFRDTPQTLREVGLAGRLRSAGGSNLKAAGEFIGWKPSRVTKGIDDFNRVVLLHRGWSKEHLLDVAEGYEQIARIQSENPSTAGRAAQLREIVRLFDD